MVEREEQERRAEKLVPSTLERLCSNEEEYYYLSYAICSFLCYLQCVTSEYMRASDPFLSPTPMVNDK